MLYVYNVVACSVIFSVGVGTSAFFSPVRNIQRRRKKSVSKRLNPDSDQWKQIKLQPPNPLFWISMNGTYLVVVVLALPDDV